MAKKAGLNAPPPAPTTSKSQGSKKRAPEVHHPEDQRPSSRQRKSSDAAIPITSADALSARLDQLKLSDSIVGHSLQALDAVGSAMTEADKRFFRSMETELLVEFGVHRAVQVWFPCKFLNFNKCNV